MFGVALALALLLREKAPPKPPVAGVIDSRVAKARALLDGDPLMTRGNVELAEQLALEAIARNPTDAEACAVAAWANYQFLSNNYDDTAQRRADMKNYADKARLLDPDSVNAELAMCGVLLATQNLAEAQARLQALAARAPENFAVLRTWAWASLRGGAGSGVAGPVESAALTRLRALSPRGRAEADTIVASRLWTRGEYAEADRLLDGVFASGHPTLTSYLVRLLVRLYGWGDLGEARDFVAGMPAKLLLEDVFIGHVTNLWLFSGEYDKGLETLARTPRPMLHEALVEEPTALLRGDLLTAAGRTAAAAIQWNEAMKLVNQRLEIQSDNASLHRDRAELLFRLGDRAAAVKEFALVEELTHASPGSIAWGHGYAFQALIGDMDAATARLDRSIARDNPRWPGAYNHVRYDPSLKKLRENPQVQSIMARGAQWLAEMRAGATGAMDKPAPGAAAATDKSVAVLAFADLSEKHDSEYFSDGISEELLNVLAKVPGLKVSARTSAFYFKGKEVPVPEIARQLGVAYVIEGSVRKQGDKVRITAQLIKAADGFHVWSDTFTRDLKDIFAVQDEIAGLIAKTLELKIGVVAARPTIDVEAYQEYLAGRALFAKADNDDLRAAVGHFEKAVAIEPKFTAAWVQLASVHTQLGRWGGTPTLAAWAAARAAIDHAVALEPDSPDVLLALGWILRTADWNWRGAERAYRRALELRPNHPDTLSAAAVLLFNIGQKDEALSLGRQGMQLDPLNPATQIDLSLVFYFSGEWAEQEKLIRRAIQLAPTGVGYHGLLADSLAGQRRFAEAEAEARVETDDVGRFSALGIIAALQGQAEPARGYRRQLEEISRTRGDTADLQLGIADICALLGDKDQGFAALEKSVATRDPSVSWFRNDNSLQGLRADARWDALLRRVGLADDQLK